MLGAIFGDIAGSVYEFDSARARGSLDLFRSDSHFTDDTVCTLAVAEALLDGTSVRESLIRWCRRYDDPRMSYGGRFHDWVQGDDHRPYNSFGNGSAMRVSAAGGLANTAEEAMTLAEKSAAPTHNHPEGVRGAQAVALAIYLARTGTSPIQIAAELRDQCRYDVTRPYVEIRKEAKFDETCQVSVPQAITCALQSTDFEDAVEKAIGLGADADTQAAIAGSIAEHIHGLPTKVLRFVRGKLPTDMLVVLDRFQAVGRN